jgi:hypothetical protein
MAKSGSNSTRIQTSLFSVLRASRAFVGLRRIPHPATSAPTRSTISPSHRLTVPPSIPDSSFQAEGRPQKARRMAKCARYAVRGAIGKGIGSGKVGRMPGEEEGRRRAAKGCVRSSFFVLRSSCFVRVRKPEAWSLERKPRKLEAGRKTQRR